MPDIDQILAAAPVIPVLVIDRIEDAVPSPSPHRRRPSGKSLANAGRARAIRAIPLRRNRGAGTVLVGRLDAPREAGARFIVPGSPTAGPGRTASACPSFPASPHRRHHAGRDLGFTRLHSFRRRPGNARAERSAVR